MLLVFSMPVRMNCPDGLSLASACSRPSILLPPGNSDGLLLVRLKLLRRDRLSSRRSPVVHDDMDVLSMVSMVDNAPCGRKKSI
jgi:hypothetical protein